LKFGCLKKVFSDIIEDKRIIRKPYEGRNSVKDSKIAVRSFRHIMFTDK
jgi:hypothetical protein